MPKLANGFLWVAEKGDWRIEIIRSDAFERIEREQELVGKGVPLPFGSRFVLDQSSQVAFVTVLNANRECVGGFAVHSRRAPIVVGHHQLWVEQFGSSIPLDAAEAAVSVLVDWIRSDRGVLRVRMDVFSFDEKRRDALGRVLAQHGFRRSAQTSGYTETLLIDLNRTEEEIFSSLHHSARRKLRQLDKHPLVVKVVDDPMFSERMNQLLQETLQRTGGRFDSRDWNARMELARQHPSLTRIIGLFRTDTTDADSLLAFACGCHSGDHVWYAEAASTRDTGGLRVPLAYAPMWDLITWAKRTGARWFDLGGITHGTHTDEDPLGGISDFKRYFSQEVVTARDEWILDDHSWRASLAAAVHSRVRRR